MKRVSRFGTLWAIGKFLFDVKEMRRVPHLVMSQAIALFQFGTEAISLFFPEIKDPIVIQPDTRTSSEFELYTQSSNDGWSARIIVPETLIQSGALSFSIARTHGGSSSVETSPLPCMPWDINPAPIVINTRLWNTIDVIPNYTRNLMSCNL